MNIKNIKNASNLKYYHKIMHPDSTFFDHSTMKFFGDTMSNYKIKKHLNYIELIRKNPVKCGLKDSAFFDLKSLNRIFLK